MRRHRLWLSDRTLSCGSAASHSSRSPADTAGCAALLLCAAVCCAAQLLLFLHRLRALLQSWPAVCLLSLPAALLSASTLSSLRHCVHQHLALHSLPASSAYAPQHSALLCLSPPSPLHTLTPLAPQHSRLLLQAEDEASDELRLHSISLPPDGSGEADGQPGHGLGSSGGQQARPARGAVELEEDEDGQSSRASVPRAAQPLSCRSASLLHF